MSTLDLSGVKVGTMVKLRNGETDVVIENDGSGVPVCLERSGWYFHDCRNAGKFSSLNIVEVLSDEPQTDLPVHEVLSAPAIALRDVLAGCAMQGMLVNSAYNDLSKYKIADSAYEMADYMMKARA